MIFWYLLISAPSTIHAKESQFECGDHGRFEYCIDGIPGCIVGCHCHPGYYFDTESKICEPNSKLTQNYRRKFSEEPTRIYHGNSFEMLETTTFTSTVNYMDDHVDAIAQNTDDLGDWLYNQFFKTIEKQIINKTDNKVMTRRSGKGPMVKTKKRFKKVRKGSSKRKQKDDLRRKLLRITEDDSLFNSDSDADTDAETEDDSSHSSSSDETRENKDNEHGHKKFVIVNKKPKPPLPSFIFLPNVETPFYPPVGLPPPVLPMYPMVPVPPVLPSPYMPNMPPDCDPMVTATNATTLSPTQATSISMSSTQAVTESNSLSATTSEATTTSTNPSSTPLTRKRLKKKKHLRDKNEILRRLQELVQNTDTIPQPVNMSKTPGIAPINDIQKDSIDVVDEFPIKPNNNNELEFRANYQKHTMQQEDTPNFKYLSELIHHLNESRKAVVTVQPSFQKLKTLIDLQRNKRIMNARPKIVDPTRRFNFKVQTEAPNPETEFYTNLGKQIATLIRGVDTKYERQIDIEIEHNKNAPNQPMFNELNYLPNSYWERFARSPVNYIRQDVDKITDLNKGNEALYHLENIVEMAASTKSPMSLVELENVVSVIEKPLQDMQKVPSKVKNSHNTLNINLWPQLPLVNPILNSVKPAIEYLKQHLNCTHEETKEVDASSDHKSTPAQDSSYTQLIKENRDNNSNNNIQNYTIERRSNDNAIKNFFPEDEIPYSINMKRPEELGLLMEFLNRQPPQLPSRRSIVHKQLPTMSPLFDYNPKMSFYHVNSQFPIYNTASKQALALFQKSSHQVATPRSYFHRELHPFDFIE